MLYDGRRHASVLAHPELRERSFAVFSFGKTLHATGWRTGYCVAPPPLTRELRKVHQFNTFSIAAPLQYAIARYDREHAPRRWSGLSAFFQAKRDLLVGHAARLGIRADAGGGHLFPAGRLWRARADASDLEFADRLIREAKVATIPLSPFYAAPPPMTLLRLCIAKREETLRDAASRLLEFARGR